MNKTVAFFMTLIGLGPSACSPSFQNASVKEFAALIDSPDVQLVDVRTIEEYQDGHLEGAINIDVEEEDFVQKAKEKLNTSKKVAVYCKSGRRASKAAEQLTTEGYQVTNLKGGIMAWKLQQMPVTKDKTQSVSQQR